MSIITAITPARVSSGPVRWVLAATLILLAGSLYAQAESTERTACPAMDADGSCPHGPSGMHDMSQGHHGKSMHGGHGGAGGPGPMAQFERMGEELALTEPQKQELAALMQMYRPRIEELGERGQANLRALMDTAPDDPAYNKQAEELSKQAGASAAELVTLMTEFQANAFALLTPEQKAKFIELRAEQRARMEVRKAEMDARRAAGESGYGPGHGPGHHRCKACDWLDEDDVTRESAE